MTKIVSKAGIYFGAATLFGLLGWFVLGGQYPQSADWLFVAVGGLLFFFIDDLIARLSPRWFTGANLVGYAITILFAIGFGVKMWLDVG
jgi:zinc transporter ZupT